jgi:hypothetical protein
MSSHTLPAHHDTPHQPTSSRRSPRQPTTHLTSATALACPYLTSTAHRDKPRQVPSAHRQPALAAPALSTTTGQAVPSQTSPALTATHQRDEPSQLPSAPPRPTTTTRTSLPRTRTDLPRPPRQVSPDSRPRLTAMTGGGVGFAHAPLPRSTCPPRPVPGPARRPGGPVAAAGRDACRPVAAGSRPGRRWACAQHCVAVHGPRLAARPAGCPGGPGSWGR